MVFVSATLRSLPRLPLLLLLREGAKSVCVRACVRAWVRSFFCSGGLGECGNFIFSFFGQPSWAWRRPMRERGDKKGERLLATATTTLGFSCSHWLPVGFALSPKNFNKNFFGRFVCKGLSNNLLNNFFWSYFSNCFYG